MSNLEKPLSQEVYDILKDGGIKESTCKAFRELYDYVEFEKPISKYKLKKFEKCGIFYPEDNKIGNPEDGLGLLMQALTYNGMFKMKIGNKEYGLEE